MREEKRYHPLAVVRERHNLTQKRLAEVVRIGERTVTRAENNKPISAESRGRRKRSPYTRKNVIILLICIIASQRLIPVFPGWELVTLHDRFPSR